MSDDKKDDMDDFYNPPKGYKRSGIALPLKKGLSPEEEKEYQENLAEFNKSLVGFVNDTMDGEKLTPQEIGMNLIAVATGLMKELCVVNADGDPVPDEQIHSIIHMVAEMNLEMAQVDHDEIPASSLTSHGKGVYGYVDDGKLASRIRDRLTNIGNGGGYVNTTGIVEKLQDVDFEGMSEDEIMEMLDSAIDENSLKKEDIN
jgi:hypothetical protein